MIETLGALAVLTAGAVALDKAFTFLMDRL